MKILILGSWQEELAERFAKELDELGRLLAERGHKPIIAPGAGAYGRVGLAYRSHGGVNSVGYYASESDRARMGEQYVFEPDEKVMTHEDYPMRNVIQTRAADAIIAVTGKTGTVTDFIAGVVDYRIPCAYLRGSSPNMDLLTSQFDGIVGKPNLFVGDTVRSLLDFVEEYDTL